MTSPTLAADLAGHAARNIALLRRLRELGVDVTQPRSIDLHFFAPTVAGAEFLAAELRTQCFDSVSVDSGGIRSGQTSVIVTLLIAPTSVATPAFVESLLRTAARFHATHDGWGTQV